jgi:hypothetical protein
MAEHNGVEFRRRLNVGRRYPWRIVVLLLLLPQQCESAPRKKNANEEYLYNAMPREDSSPVIDYVPPPNNHTKNLSGGSELYHPSFLYSTTGPAAVARVVEFYA